MTWMVLGILLWSAAHFFKRLAPDARAKLGNGGKGLVAVLSLVGIILMVVGYRAADVVGLWYLGDAAISVNNVLMLCAVALMGVGDSKSRLRGKLRHPMLTGFLVWAVAHLLVNGDLSSLVLFGGLSAWAVAEIVLINRAEPAPEPYLDGTAKGDIRLAVITVVIFAVIVGIHTFFGRWPFPG